MQPHCHRGTSKAQKVHGRHDPSASAKAYVHCEKFPVSTKWSLLSAPCSFRCDSLHQKPDVPSAATCCRRGGRKAENPIESFHAQEGIQYAGFRRNHPPVESSRICLSYFRVAVLSTMDGVCLASPCTGARASLTYSPRPPRYHSVDYTLTLK